MKVILPVKSCDLTKMQSERLTPLKEQLDL